MGEIGWNLGGVGKYEVDYFEVQVLEFGNLGECWFLFYFIGVVYVRYLFGFGGLEIRWIERCLEMQFFWDDC